MNAPPPLIDLLGARWRLGAPVAALAWTRGEAGRALAGFILGDGTLAMAPGAWEGAPTLEERAGGRITLVPGAPDKQRPPLARLAVHRGAGLALAGDTEGGFLSGGEDGRFVLVSADGAVRLLAEFSGLRVEKVAAGGPWRACAAGRPWRACAAGGAVHVFGAAPARIDLPGPAQALSFDPGGEFLAVGHAGGVSLWQAGRPVRRLESAGRVCALAWSPDGRLLAAALEDGRLVGWRLADGARFEFARKGEPALSLSVADHWLAASGGAQVACWDLARPGSAALPCGLVATRAPLSHVAWHPVKGPIAAAYRNGAVLLCQPESDEALFVRAAPAAPLRGLAWSADGDFLALGSDDGEAAMVSLPPLLFRGRPAAEQASLRNSA